MQRFSRLTLLVLLLAALFTAGCGSSSKKDYPVTVTRFLVEATGDEVGVNLRLPVSGVVVRAGPKAILTEYDIVSAQVVESDLGPAVMFQLTTQASRDMFRLTATNLGRRLVTTVNGLALGVTRLDRPLGDGVVISYLEVKPEALSELVENINKTSADMQKEVSKRK